MSAIVEEFAGTTSPSESEGEQAHPFGEAFGMGEVSLLQMEAATFQTTEEGFDLPAVGISGQGLAR